MGECDYETGNYAATRLVEYTKKVLDAVGVGGERLQMAFCSAAEGSKFQETATEADKTIRSLGPSPLTA